MMNPNRRSTKTHRVKKSQSYRRCRPPHAGLDLRSCFQHVVGAAADDRRRGDGSVCPVVGQQGIRAQVAVPAEIIEVSEDGEGGGDGRAAGGSQLDTPSDEPFVGKDKETTDLQQDLTVLGTAAAASRLSWTIPNWWRRRGTAASAPAAAFTVASATAEDWATAQENPAGPGIGR